MKHSIPFFFTYDLKEYNSLGEVVNTVQIEVGVVEDRRGNVEIDMITYNSFCITELMQTHQDWPLIEDAAKNNYLKRVA